MNADKGVSQIELVLRQMRAGFLAELPERCDRLEASVLALESGKTPEGGYEELYRNVHSLKGTGGTFGLPLITSICHQFESYLAETHGRYTQAFGGVCLDYVDLIRQVGRLAEADRPDYSPVEAGLERMRVAMLRSRRAVLIADSSATMRSLYLQALSALRVQLTAVDTGLAALDRLLHQPYDLLIVARELAELNGTGVVAALRESRSKNRGVPVILVSSSQDDPPEHLGIQYVVRKDKDLVAALTEHVGKLIG